MKPVHEALYDIISRETDGETPERMSSSQIILQMVAARTNNCCHVCRSSDDIIIVDAEHDRYKCGLCGGQWQQAWRLIHSPVVKQPTDEDGKVVDFVDLELVDPAKKKTTKKKPWLVIERWHASPAKGQDEAPGRAGRHLHSRHETKKAAEAAMALLEKPGFGSWFDVERDKRR